MARWTKKLLKEQMGWTDECYKKALIEVYGADMTPAEKEQNVIDMKRMIWADWNEEIRTPEINAIYLRNLCQLESEKLSLILEAFQKGKQHRAQVTMDAIMTELFERSANSETRGKDES